MYILHMQSAEISITSFSPKTREQRQNILKEGSEALQQTIMHRGFMSQGYDDPTTIPRRKNRQLTQEALVA